MRNRFATNGTNFMSTFGLWTFFCLFVSLGTCISARGETLDDFKKATDSKGTDSIPFERLRQEADIAVDKLPKAVTEAVMKAHPTCKITEAANATAGDKKFLALDIKVGEEMRGINIKEDGTIIADEVVKSLPTDGEKK